jgi:hypothetical protein
MTATHLQRAMNARIEEYQQVVKVYRRSEALLFEASIEELHRFGRPMVLLPGWAGPDGDPWIRLGSSFLGRSLRGSTEEESMAEEGLQFNGLDATTGRPLLRAATPSELVPHVAAKDREVPEEVHAVRATALEGRRREHQLTLGVIAGIDPLRLEQARWGVAYAPGTSPAVREQLARLIAARDGREFDIPPNCTALDFRVDHGQAPGNVNPDNLPYYLLIVGPPSAVSFEFQQDLANQHAVGRLDFDTPEEYGAYVEGLLNYERGLAAFPRERRLALFSPVHLADRATELSSRHLAKPLADAFSGKQIKTLAGPSLGYASEHLSGALATKTSLGELLIRDTRRPAAVFVAGHGLGYPSGWPAQRELQGAIACHSANWTGPVAAGGQPIPEGVIFGAPDIPDGVRLDGLVVVAFGCFSAGTPREDSFPSEVGGVPALAPEPFVARLPQRLLAAGALAFIGHVDRALDFSFLWEGIGSDVSPFESTLHEVLAGHPIGHALDHFNARDLALGGLLSTLLTRRRKGHLGDPNRIASCWLARNDAHGYVLFGDPYARIFTSSLEAAL